MIRPTIISHQAAQFAAALTRCEMQPRVLTLQAPDREPHARGWGLLPAVTPPLVVDFSGSTVAMGAMLLDDLRRTEQREGVVPLVLVPRAAHALHRLLAASHLAALVLPADAPVDCLARWLTCPLAIGAAPVWVGLPPATPPTSSPHLLALLAALTRADTMAQAAAWCGLSRRRAYEVLQACATALHLPVRPWRVPQQWVATLSRALAQPPGSSSPSCTTDELSPNQRLDLLAATLCGCTIRHIRIHDDYLALDLDEPRQGPLTLTFQRGVILDAAAPHAALPQRPAWARTVDWVDVRAPNILDMFLVDGVRLSIQFQRATFNRTEERA